MDIIYTSLLDVNHKEVSPQTSFRLSHRLWLRLKATATLHFLLLRTFLHGPQQPTKGHWHSSGICQGIIVGIQHWAVGACTAGGNIPHTLSCSKSFIFSSALLWDVRNKALPEPILIAQLPNAGYQRDPPGSTLLGGDSMQTLEMWTNNTAGVTVYSSPRRFLHS